MDATELMNLITQGEWQNSKTGEICSFYWIEANQSIVLEFKTGEHQGHRFSHQFVKLYPSPREESFVGVLNFQSNLFHTIFRLQSENGPLFVESDVFKEMELQRK